MASSSFDDFGFNPDLYLNPVETDLLVAALESNRPVESASTNGTKKHNGADAAGNDKPSSSNGLNNNAELSHHPYLDFDTSEGWDWNLRGLPEHFGDDIAPSMERKDSAASEEDDDEDKQRSPSVGEEGEPGDKRKNSEDPAEDDGGGKRQETDQKNGKKQSQRPGRKPLTSEPTTKRKAQNRAAQRAFRERKEKHLKDLETKVEELEKASASTNHENSLLRAQVERLQTELKEYKRQMSLSSNMSGGSPTFGSIGQPFSSRANWDINNNFNFEFPKFGPVNDGKLRSPSLNTVFSKASSSSQAPQRSNTISNPTSIDSDLSSLFPADVLSRANNRSNPNISASAQKKKVNGKDNNRPTTGVLPRNSTDSDSASPASSGSNLGFTSSCATTPEATCETPDQRKDSGISPNSGVANGGKFNSQEAFCKDFQTACGNTENPVPLVMSNSSNEVPALTPALTTHSQDSSLDFNGFDWLANQNGGVFDPILFGDYREPQENVMNNNSLDFFNDAFPSLDFPASDMQPQTHPLQSSLPKKKDLMQDIEDRQAGKEPEVVPGEERQQFLTCNLLWDRVQRSQKVLSGEAEMDDLCSQLKAKAKCSGSGAVISQSDVDAILGPDAPKDKSPPDYLKMFK